MMSTTKNNHFVQSHLFFNGHCEEAVEFYRKALGAEAEFTMRFDEIPELHLPGMVPPGFESEICTVFFAAVEPRSSLTSKL